ncbi:MAG: peptidylprolyl isomerase [Brumimicrobium sp.]|nr:peptidylprolyl isomerase [Brumimicrobium sp.]
MALIGKIREKSWLLIAVIGIAMLAFIIGDLDSIFNRSGQEDVYGIGTVNGEKVDEDLYNTYLNNARQNIFQNKQRQSQGQQVRFDENDEKNARSQAWNAAVAAKLMDKEIEQIGLIVDEFELENILYGMNGYEPSVISAQFRDSVTGEFAPDQLRQAIRQMEDSGDPEKIEQLNATMDYVKETRLTEKYNALLLAGIHTTSLEGKEEYDAQKTVKNVSYVFQSFTKVPQEAIGEISDEEVKEYYEKHKTEEKYKQKASRKLSYFAVPVVPNKEDSLIAKNMLKNLKSKFEKSENDSVFVMRFSDVKEFRNDSTAVAKPEGSGQAAITYPLSVASEIENAQPGDVIGPYTARDGLKISKILRFVNEPTATVRHILLGATTPEEVEKAQKKADSIVQVIRSKNNFEEMVTEFSEDPGSKNTGGKYEDFAQGTMVPTFNDFSFQKPIGTLGTVKTDYGIHIIEVLGRKETKRPILANVVKMVEPTKSTVDDITSKASDMIYELDRKLEGKDIQKKRELFDTFVVENGYTIRSLTINDDAPKADGFTDNGEARMLRLAYEEGAAEGQLSSSPIREKTRIIIAMISEITEEGVPTFEKVKDRMTAEVRKEKQGQYLVDQMLNKPDLQALANELNAKYQTEGLTFSASNVAVGREPKIIGTAFSGLIDGQTSIPVVGNNGVFVLRVDSTVEAPETTDFTTEIEQLNSQKITTVQNQHRSALIQSAEVIDNRKLREYGIR